MTKTENRNLPIRGMTCASCSAAVQKALYKTDGVKHANVNLATEIATIEFDPKIVDINSLVKAVENSGYQVGNERDIADKTEGKLRLAARRMWTAWFFTIPIMLWMIPEMFYGIAWPNQQVYHIGMLTLAAIQLVVVGNTTYRSAFKSVTHGGANMDALIAMGTLAALSTGVMHFFIPIASFAGVAAMIMAIHLTGRFIETKAKGKASQAIRKLLELGAKTATVLRDGTENEVPVETLQTGDIIIIKAGNKIPTDGQIIEGEAAIDESMATGESMPIHKTVGDNIIGATIIKQGYIKAKVTKIGKDTFLSQIIKMVEEAQNSKIPIQEFADKVTSYFVPTVIVLALLSLGIWLIFPQSLGTILVWTSFFLPWVNPELGYLSQAIFAAVAVLVIACPCALGLATPTALMVGSGKGAENGILIRKGEAIQTMRHINTMVFDKTGTITTGKPQVTDLYSIIKEKDTLKLVAGIEQGSSHPLATAILDFAEQKKVKPEFMSTFQTIAGKGMKAKKGEDEFLLGNIELMQENNVVIDKFKSKIKDLQNQAKTLVMLAKNKQVIGLLAIADKIKHDSATAVNKLQKLGFRTIMLTGDNHNTAQAIAKEANIDEIIANVMPDQKVATIKNLQNKYGLVAMVGDGINDAPALKQADIGIAIGSGTDIAIESADITLVNNSLTSVVKAIILSQKTFRKIKQNLFWAFAYNIVAIPLAFLGMLHPVIAEIAMAFSSITVVSNANLLKREKLEI
ncbi:MAG: heavy metal translocating P-type ATPase [Candidatus Cloacimonadota bacterium]|nr:heavy metal translocating P-type ATPase [Candidatus Cloacimonadota bacterium]